MPSIMVKITEKEKSSDEIKAKWKERMTICGSFNKVMTKSSTYVKNNWLQINF